MLDLISDALAQIQPPGGSESFVARARSSTANLHIEVRGVGQLQLPIRASQAEELRKVARPAPFGLREKTIYDCSVRNTWEVAKSRVKIAARDWKPRLTAELDKIRSALGLPQNTLLEPVFDKLLLYERGQFFKPHQDSERDDAMVGTLLIILPSSYTGGTLRIEHKGKSKNLRRLKHQDSELSWIAFYSDCHHEVTPVKSGHRIVLSYQLRLKENKPVGASSLKAPQSSVQPLAGLVGDFFETPIQERYSKEAAQPPDRLVYVLDHEYSQRSLSWGQLKGADRMRVGALRQVAERLDCECFLTLAQVHEVWSCIPDSNRFGHWYGDFGEEASSGYSLDDLIDEEVILHHWIDSDGVLQDDASSAAHAAEICCTLPSKELEPFESEYEGYQGNYGETEDRWYHRAAFVMWPRERSFLIHAKASPSWAVDMLAALPREATEELEARVRSLLPNWRSHMVRGGKPRFFARLIEVAERLQDSQLTSDFIEPVGVDPLSQVPVRRALARLVDAHGEEWGRHLFTTWTEERAWGHRTEWLPWLADICEALCAEKKPPGKRLAIWLLEREARHAREESRVAQEHRSTWLDLEAFAEEANRLVWVWDAAARIGNHSLVAAETKALATKSAGWPLHLRLSVLRGGLARSPELGQLLIGSRLHINVLADLRRLTDQPPREPDDWSIEHPIHCRGEDCAELARFLQSPLEALDWPLRKESRRRIHAVIDNHRLPVSHTTLRKGRPYVLRLRKQRKLFDREAKYFRTLRAILKELDSLVL